MPDPKTLSDADLQKALDAEWAAREAAQRNYKALAGEKRFREQVAHARKALDSIDPSQRAAVIAAAGIASTAAVGTPGSK